MEKAFNTLKSKLTQEPILSPDYNTGFVIQTDAFEKGIGIVLAQRPNSEEHPIKYLNRKFTDTEKSFSTSERE